MSEGLLQHTSEQVECGTSRQVDCEISLIALGQAAKWLDAAAVGTGIAVSGFLCAKSRNSRSLVLHVNTIEFLEGTKHGSILQEEG